MFAALIDKRRRSAASADSGPRFGADVASSPFWTRSTIKIILMDNLRITHCELCAAFSRRVVKVWPLDLRYRNLVVGGPMSAVMKALFVGLG